MGRHNEGPHALAWWARCLLMIVCQVAGGARAEESAGMYTSRSAQLWVESYSQVRYILCTLAKCPFPHCLSLSVLPVPLP